MSLLRVLPYRGPSKDLGRREPSAWSVVALAAGLIGLGFVIGSAFRVLPVRVMIVGWLTLPVLSTVGVTTAIVGYARFDETRLPVIAFLTHLACLLAFGVAVVYFLSHIELPVPS